MGREVRQADPQTLERLRRYSWPGNIRELQSVLKQAPLKATGPILLPTFLPDSFEEPCGPAAAAPTAGQLKGEAFVFRQRLGEDVRDLYAETHRQVDRLLLPRVLEFTNGNYQQAVLLLGIARQTLRLKLRELGLSVARDLQKEEGNPVKIRPSDPRPLSQVS
jgi:DNA-binding NtrC family response regulator